MRKQWRSAAVVLVAVAVAITAVGCNGGQPGTDGEEPQRKGPIVVGSKIDTEGELLSSIIKIKLEDEGFTVEDRSQTGTTDVVRRALLSGEIDIYPEYTGSGLLFFEGNAEATAETFRDPESGYETVKRLDEENDVVWLTPARANNTWTIAVREDFADDNELSTMSDFAEYVRDGKEVKLAASDEFFNNPDAFPTFAETYDIELERDQRVVFSGGNTAQTERAVADGTDGVNFGMAYGTDGALADLGLVVLEDDKQAQLVYWPTPTIRGETLDRYPEIEGALQPIFDSLELQTLQELNARIQVSGEPADQVAREYLEENGFLE